MPKNTTMFHVQTSNSFTVTSDVRLALVRWLYNFIVQQAALNNVCLPALWASTNQSPPLQGGLFSVSFFHNVLNLGLTATHAQLKPVLSDPVAAVQFWKMICRPLSGAISAAAALRWRQLVRCISVLHLSVQALAVCISCALAALGNSTALANKWGAFTVHNAIRKLDL